MSAASAILRYHGRELLLRWRAQPASPLARWLLTFALCAAAAVLLIGFAEAEAARRLELRRLGLDTVVVQAPAAGPLTETDVLPPDHWARSLAGRGSVLLLQQLPEPAFTPWDTPLAVFAAPLPTLARLAGGSHDRPPGGAPVGALWFTRSFPPGRRFLLTTRDQPLPVVTAVPGGPLQALGVDDCVVAEEARLPTPATAGRLDVVLFTPAADRPAGVATGASAGASAETAAAVRRLFAAEGLPPPAVRDPSPYQASLAAFSRSQDQWRTGMGALLCGCVLLAYASIGILEERQTRYTQALLRSLGVPGGALWTASLAENLLLANSALAAAAAASRGAAQALLSLAGASQAITAPPDFTTLVWLACAVNFGVLLSLLPLASALRRPVGSVLP